MQKQPTIFIPHGGGPCFFMDWAPPNTWKSMEVWLRTLAYTLSARPQAILVISGHWEEEVFTVSSNPAPSLIYDYHGFPEHTYHLTYPAAGAPQLAHRVRALLDRSSIPAQEDLERGFDHGVFVPLKLIYPEADIPIVQLSLKRGLDPAQHLAVGAALSPLRDENVLIIGSGMSYHNIPELMRGSSTVKATSDLFDHWLSSAISAAPETCNTLLRQWDQAPAARKAHPREEHLMPLMVVAGAAGTDQGKRIYHDYVMETALSAYQFG